MTQTLSVKRIVPGDNHRTNFDPVEMNKLREGIKAANGVIQPILVRPIGGGVHEIIAGYCRWLLSQEVMGEDYEIPVLIREATDAEAAALGIIENHHRTDTSVPEQARGAAKLLQLNKGDKQETALALGWSVETLERRLLLLHCDKEVLDALTQRRILIGHAELLAGLPRDRQVKVLAGVIEHKVSVEVLKKQLGQFAKRLADAIFDTAQCTGCIHNSAKQAGLFDESLGEGFCQHPSHFEELTLLALEQRAVPLRERFQVVKIVRPSDGFAPLHVAPGGELGVGVEQYTACQGCVSFGCSLSALPGSYGAQDDSLCFDATCHAGKVAARRRAEREAKAAQHSGVGAGPDRVAATEQSNVPAKAPAKPSNQTPPRVAQYRLQKWRTWAANRLMALPEKNHRLLAALVLSCDTQAIDTGKYAEVVAKLTKGKAGNNTFKGALEQCSVFDADAMPSVVAAVAAAAAYGLDPGNLELLLNYLDVNEAVHFTLDAEYLDLLTVSELESLADELKLKRAMGESYKKARAGKKSDFIAALLAAPGVSYAGLVPRAMRYPRRKLKTAETDRDRAAVPSTDPQPSTTADEPSAETPTAAEV